MVIEPGSPLALLSAPSSSDTASSSGPASPFAGGLALRSDILDGFTGVLTQVPLDALQRLIEGLKGALDDEAAAARGGGGGADAVLLLKLTEEESVPLVSLRDCLQEYRWRLWTLNQTLTEKPNLWSGSGSTNTSATPSSSSFSSAAATGGGTMGSVGSVGSGGRGRVHIHGGSGGMPTAPSSPAVILGSGGRGQQLLSSPGSSSNHHHTSSADATTSACSPSTSSSTASAASTAAFAAQAALQSATASKHALQQIGEALGVLVRLQRAAKSLFDVQDSQVSYRRELQIPSTGRASVSASDRGGGGGGGEVDIPLARAEVRRHYTSLIKSSNGLLTVVMKAAVFTALEAARTSPTLRNLG